MNLPELIKQFPHLKMYLAEYIDQKKKYGKFFDYFNEFKNAARDAFFAAQQMRFFKYEGDYVGMQKAFSSMLLDYFFKTRHERSLFTVARPTQLVNGSWAMTDQFYNAVSLYREVDRKAFSKQVPELHNFFRDIALMEDEEEALRQLGAWLGAAKVMGLNMSPRALYNMVKNNSFLVNVMTFGKEESAYFGVDPDMARTPAMVAALHMQFRKLPIQIRRIYAFNEFYQGNLKWKPGSLLDIIGPEFQIGPESISESMPGFRRWLNEELKKQIAIDDSKQKDRVGLIDRFVKFTQHVRGMARTLSDERFRKDFIPAVITRSMKTKRGPFLKVQARYNPAKSKTLGIRGAYVPEYSVTQKLFDSQEDLNIDTDVIRLTADEVSSIKAAKRMGVEHTFTKSYPRGHGYEANVNYVTDTGDVVMLKEDGLSWVTWQTVGEQYSNLSLKAHVEYAEALATRGRSTPKSMVISQADVSLAGVDFLVDPGAKGKSDLDRVQSAVQYTLEVSDLVIKVRPEDTDIFKMFYINEYLTANLPEKETFNLNLWDAKALSNIKTMLNKVYQDTSADQQMVVTITGPDLPYMNMDQKETDQRMDIVMKTLARHVKDLGLDLSKIVIINAGQSGADSAIIHAARKWGFKTKIIAPKGYVYRNGRNNFTKGRENFVQRFQIPDELLTPEETQKVEKAANTTGKISKEDQQYLDMVDHMSNLKYTTGYGKGHEYSFPLSIILDGQRITANAFNYLIGHFEAKFPQLRFVRENFETLKQQNKDPYLRGWVQGNEIHFNEDMVTDATPFHEFQHVWDAIMEVENPELFQSIDGQIGALLDSPGDNNVKDLSKIIKTRYLAHNVVLNDAELRSEVRAVVAGLLTRDMLNRWLLKNGVMDAVRDNSYADKIWAELGWIGEENARWLKDLLSVGQLNADGIMTIEQAIMGFADKVLNGEGVYYISDNGLDALRSKKMMPSIGGPVDNVRDVLPLLMNDKRLAKAMLGQDVGHLTDMYYINMKKSKEGNDKDGYNYFLLYAGKKYSISTTATDDEIRKYVRESVVENILEWENQLQENTQKFILQTAGNVNQEGYKDNLVEAAKSLFGEKGLSQSAIDKLAVYLGLHNGAESVINYDQLRTHQNPHVRALYKEEFSGANPIVIIHNVNNTTGEVDLSILDVTSKPVGKQSDQVDRSNIFAAISPITDNEFVHDVNQNGVNKWSNSAAHIRKLMLTMTAMSMNNGKTRIRNIGVVRVNPRHVEGYMIHDLDSAFSLVRMIEEKVPALFERLPQAIKDVITNKEKNTGMVQPYTDRLMLYLADIAEDDSQSPEVRETATLQRNKIMETFNSKETVAKIVNVRMKYLESILGDPESNPEYQMLSAMLFEYSKGIPLHKGSYATMGWLERNLVSSHNVGSKPIQWFVTTAQNISARIKAQFYKDYGPGSKLYELGEILRKKHGPKGLASAKDIGSILYGPIRKTIKLKDMEIADKSNPALANLDPETEIRLPEFHWTMKDPETREKVLDPNDPLTEDHLKFAEEVHRLIREKYIDLIYHRESTSRKNMNETGESSFTRQDAEKMYDEVYGNLADSKHPYRRSMPVMSKSMNELFQSKSYKAVKKRFGQSIGASEMTNENFYDSTTDERKAKDLFNDMYNQMDYNNQLSKLGVYWNGANYVLSSYENNFMATDNFEKMTRYFLLESSRYIAFDNELMPVLKSVRAIHNLLEQQGVPAEDLKQEKEYLKQISERLIERINGDRNLKQDLNIFGLHMPLSKPIRIVSQAMSNAVLAFRVAVMAKSEIGNTRRALWDAMAQSIGDAIVKNAPEAERHYWPGVKQVFDGWWKSHISEIRKTWNLAKQLQVIRGSMDDMYSNPWLGNYDRLNPWKVSVMHIGNRFTDEMARAWGMVSIMIHDGSWEAYSYDKKNKKMVYDITKDRQYYQPDGTQTAEQKVLEEHLRRELVKDGLMVKETDELPQGYTLRDSMQRLKYFGDKFILSGLDEHTKPLLTNNYMGQLLGAFKMFQMEPLFAGSFAQERSVEHGGIKTVETDETGHMEVVYKDQKVEGGLTSVMKAYRAISEGLKDGKIQEHLGQMSPIARKNMARMCLNVATFAVFFAMIKGFVDKDKQMQFSFILSDILLIYMIGEWMTNPVPLAAQTKKLMDVAVGQRGIKYLLDFAGPLSDVRKYVMLGE